MLVFFFNATATTEIYTLSLHDALPISKRVRRRVWLVFRNLFCYLPIESACANDLFDRARNEILNRAAAGDAVSNFGCGNIDSPIHTQIFVDDRGRSALQNNECYHMAQILKASPTRQPGKIIIANK